MCKLSGFKAILKSDEAKHHGLGENSATPPTNIGWAGGGGGGGGEGLYFRSSTRPADRCTRLQNPARNGGCKGDMCTEASKALERLLYAFSFGKSARSVRKRTRVAGG